MPCTICQVLFVMFLIVSLSTAPQLVFHNGIFEFSDRKLPIGTDITNKPDVLTEPAKCGQIAAKCCVLQLIPLMVGSKVPVSDKKWNILLLLLRDLVWTLFLCTLCLKKVSTFKLCVTLSKLNRFLKFLHCWKAHEICYKSFTQFLTTPWLCCYTTMGVKSPNLLQITKHATKNRTVCGKSEALHVIWLKGY